MTNGRNWNSFYIFGVQLTAIRTNISQRFAEMVSKIERNLRLRTKWFWSHLWCHKLHLIVFTLFHQVLLMTNCMYKNFCLIFHLVLNNHRFEIWSPCVIHSHFPRRHWQYSAVIQTVPLTTAAGNWTDRSIVEVHYIFLPHSAIIFHPWITFPRRLFWVRLFC